MEHRVPTADDASRANPAWLWAFVIITLLSIILKIPTARAAVVDLNAGTLSFLDDTFTSPGLNNALVVTLVGGTYTIDDPAETAIALLAGATAGGCAPVDANTVNCPAAGITSLTIQSNLGDDHVTLNGVTVLATIIGGRGNDTLVGGNEPDIFDWNPGDGSDTIDGGGGDDVLGFAGSNIAESISVVPDGTGFLLFRNIANITMSVQHVEALAVSSLAGADTIFTTPLAGITQNFVDGSPPQSDDQADLLHVDGNGLCVTRQGDTFEAPGRGTIHLVDIPQVVLENVFCPLDPCVGAVATMGCTVNRVRNQPCQGTSGDDVIIGTVGPDVILGGGGNDRISGGAGDDLLCGEAGDDVLGGKTGNDTLVGGPGLDRLRGSSGNDTLSGGDDADLVDGGNGDDDIDGGDGDDKVKGGAGIDTLRGGEGLDRIDGGSGEDRCSDTDQTGPFPRCEL